MQVLEALERHDVAEKCVREIVCWFICMKLYYDIFTNILYQHTFKFLSSLTYSFTNVQKTKLGRNWKSLITQRD